MFQPKLNPTAFTFIGFTTVIGIICGDIWAGLAVGLGISCLDDLLNSRKK